ncbi:DUF1932 domain-containing protein [Streptomyces sp. NPDC047046]|uniref:NAD(P)-dependent oxidoreductase n=1 Tax=Streptomyces sp. NPDC047046 TaxID=3155378 RepID=UPI0033FBDB54
MSDPGTAADPTPVVGLLHPGSMGAAFGAVLRARGHEVLWCPEGRSAATCGRAEAAGLRARTLPELVARAGLLLSLCPPDAAEAVAREVAAHAPRPGTVYVEANAIAPRRVRDIAALLGPAVPLVDGAVVGSPPRGGKSPLLFLSGPDPEVARLAAHFSGTDVRARPLGPDLGRASALKLVYSLHQKSSRLLAALSLGAAREYGVEDELLEIAGQRAGSYLTETDYVSKTAARSWRWAPELADAAELLAEAGLPAEAVRAAAGTLARWNPERAEPADVAAALALLRRPRTGEGPA